jgi:hypothetical protein
MGWLRDLTDSYSAGLLVLAAALVLEALLVISLRLPDSRARARTATPAVGPVAPVRRP